MTTNRKTKNTAPFHPRVLCKMQTILKWPKIWNERRRWKYKLKSAPMTIEQTEKSDWEPHKRPIAATLLCTICILYQQQFNWYLVSIYLLNKWILICIFKYILFTAMKLNYIRCFARCLITKSYYITCFFFFFFYFYS